MPLTVWAGNQTLSGTFGPLVNSAGDREGKGICALIVRFFFDP